MDQHLRTVVSLLPKTQEDFEEVIEDHKPRLPENACDFYSVVYIIFIIRTVNKI